MSRKPFFPRFIVSSLNITASIYHLTDAILSGFWLGIMSEKALDRLNEYHYSEGLRYMDDKYNLSGLAGWEKEMIGKHFAAKGKILLIAAGGGRETLALYRMGFMADSFECNPDYVRYGNDFLKRSGIEAKISYLPAGSLPDLSELYDGAIIGWGAYSHIYGKLKRTDFLERVKALLKPGASLMISFMVREEKNRHDKIVSSVARIFNVFSIKEKPQPGDRIYSYYTHFFCRCEIHEEFSAAGYMLVDYYNVDYGCAVGVPVTGA